MTSMSLPTEFAPAERASHDTVCRQNKLLHESFPLRQLYDSVTEVVVVLNEERQIVFFNQNLVDLLGVDDPDSLYGLRPGEALNCLRAFEKPGGCGTTEFCSTCGAVSAILASRKGKRELRECTILRNGQGGALNLFVSATPLPLGKEQFTIFAVTDISHEKRRRALERIFFHDIMNTALSVRLLAQFLADQTFEPSDDIENKIYRASDILVEEIQWQKDLMAAESHDLPVEPVRLSSMALLGELAELHGQYADLGQCRIVIDARAQDVRFKSDRTILLRVLGNMVKNAVEASPVGKTVTVGCKAEKGGIKLWVHNSGLMPKEVQLQLFQRSFSTKGPDRGLGTYSMKLLSERYLKGKVSFTTSELTGTTFTAWYPSVIHGEKPPTQSSI
jgi:K+-sensing histidine kinase KdpD